jgi:hypothetical protein
LKDVQLDNCNLDEERENQIPYTPTHTHTHTHTMCSSSYLSIRVSDIRCGKEIELDVASGDSSVLDFHDEVLAIS